MNIVDRIIRKFELLKYNVAFVDNTLEGILNNESLKYTLLKHHEKNWFADPFILDVTDEHIILLVEEYDYKRWKGHISKLIVDRRSKELLTKKTLLCLDTHLSYPAILRSQNLVYVYPESGQSGNLRKYMLKGNKLLPEEIILTGAFADATITNLFGDYFLFCTRSSECSGNCLYIYHENKGGEWKFYQKVQFREKIARMAGDFFKVGNYVYRPAQDCNECYGHGTVIQKVELINGKFVFTEVTRYFSPDKRMGHGIHTLNSYKNVIVVDMEGYEWPTLAWIGKFLRYIWNRS